MHKCRFKPGDRVVCIRWSSELYGLRGTIVSSKMHLVPSRVRETWEERVHVIFDTAEVAHDDGGDGYLDEPTHNLKDDMIPF